MSLSLQNVLRFRQLLGNLQTNGFEAGPTLIGQALCYLNSAKWQHDQLQCLTPSVMPHALISAKSYSIRSFQNKSFCLGKSCYSTLQQNDKSEDESLSDKEDRATLGAALSRLVDSAVELVEKGDMEGAIRVYNNGIDVLKPAFPQSPELGELHNQAALLLFAQGRCEEALQHSLAAQEITLANFGSNNILAGYRKLRVGTCAFGLGRLTEAAEYLQEASQLLGGDSAQKEADFYSGLVVLSSATDVADWKALEDLLVACVAEMKDKFGADSMVLSLALAHHGRVVTTALERGDPQLGEVALRQALTLMEARDPNGDDTGIAAYKLATYCYSLDLLVEADRYLRQATSVLRGIYPEDHDLVMLCRHRQGMICAASGDHRSAAPLLTASSQHYQKQEAGHLLSKEAEIGLCLVRFRALDPRLPSGELHAAQREELTRLRGLLDELAAGTGHSHMLVSAGARWLAQLQTMTGIKL